MDQLDRAQQIEEADRENALRGLRCSQSEMPSKGFCESCQDPIPKARQLAIRGVAVCVECQTQEENLAKHRQ